MRFLILLLSACLVSAAAGAEDAPRIVVTVHGDHVEYDHELNTVAVQGQVQITARSDRPGAPTVAMTADQVEGDLTHGILIAHGGIKLLSQQAALTGETVRLNIKNDEFVLENGAASVDVPSQQYPGTVVRGYLLGDQLARQGNVIILIEGRITTCDRARPHYSIGARKISYDLAKYALRVEGGTITLYGHTLSLPGSLTVPVGGPESDAPLLLPIPQYSSYEGLYFPLATHLDWEGVPWQVDAYLHLGTALRLAAGLQVTNEGEQGMFTAALSRREQAVWDFNQRSRVSRVPEFRYVRHLQPTGKGGLSPLDVEVFAGHLYEQDEDRAGLRREASRAGLAVHYSPMPQQRRQREGYWAAADLYETLYDTGDHLADLRLEGGAGWRLNDNVSGALWAVHHESGGQSPFNFDDVYAEDEGFARVALHLSRRQQVALYGHYDFDRSELRDYSARYSYRAHCLTWNMEYNFARQALTVGVDINGLTGGTPPVTTAPLVRPEEMPPLPEPVPVPAGPAPAPKAVTPLAPPAATTAPPAP